MIHRTFSSLSLLARFTLVSFFLTLLIAIGLAWRLEYALERDALSAVADNTAHQATNILNQNLTTADLQTALQASRYEQIDALLHNTLLSSDIVRIKVWNRDGLLVYSDERNLVGKTFPINEELQEAFGGEVATDISDLQAEENIGERGRYEKLFEIYVPVQPADTDTILGAYEVYYDLSKLQPRLTHIRYTVGSSVGLAFVFLYGALFLIVRNASRELIQKNKENQVLLVTERRERELSERLERVSRALSEISDCASARLICRRA